MQNTIEYQYDEVHKTRLVLINGMYVMVDPEDIHFWSKAASVSLTEQEKVSVSLFLIEKHLPPNKGKFALLDGDVEIIGKVVNLEGVRIYRKVAR